MGRNEEGTVHCAHGTVYLGLGYVNLHVGENCGELHTHADTDGGT